MDKYDWIHINNWFRIIFNLACIAGSLWCIYKMISVDAETTKIYYGVLALMMDRAKFQPEDIE